MNFFLYNNQYTEMGIFISYEIRLMNLDKFFFAGLMKYFNFQGVLPDNKSFSDLDFMC
jgi:hypothetical protein